MLTRLLIATVLVVVAISTSCESKYQAKNSNYECTYKLVYISNESCNNPLAENCAVKAIGSTNIIMYNSAAECAAFCCDPSFYNMFCSYTQSSYMVVVIIALSCFLFLLVAAICCYRLKDQMCYCCCWCFRCFRDTRQVTNSHPGPGPVLQSQNDTMMNMESSEKKWEMDRDFSEQQECSVCLCDQTNFVLPCGHTFHKACILECFRRKYECILCRRTQLSSFKLYCNHCLKRYITLYYYDLRYWDKGNGETTCDNCIKIEHLSSQGIK